ncbi:PREDICTED: uncharacterized protein LOC105569019 [Vollenhovia emeryi]|uniref:uncharacterized protein LOC105569019 n=1 Tax=Vollenhovia emeryi TaxID=411798 RepID=UPI0005F481B5|nr:PREDICTED: uncharacterized protein LOC105569019 [Vollenhovia emeryi]
MSVINFYILYIKCRVALIKRIVYSNRLEDNDAGSVASRESYKADNPDGPRGGGGLGEASGVDGITLRSLNVADIPLLRVDRTVSISSLRVRGATQHDCPNRKIRKCSTDCLKGAQGSRS